MRNDGGLELVVRADADRHIGTGHIMRCLGLGQAWKAVGGHVTFVTACENQSLLRRLNDEDVDICVLKHSYPERGDWKQTREVLSAYPEAWVILDGYHFDDDYHRRIKESEHQLMVIDDMAHLRRYVADVILNQNIHAPSLQYACELPSRMLLGSKYVLLRREFLQLIGFERENPQTARKVLVTLGGADPHNVTSQILEALQKDLVKGLEVSVVVGANNPHFDQIKQMARRFPSPIHVARDIGNMPELMAWADLAISAGGSTCWELAFMGLPSLILVLSENQQPIAEKLDIRGVAMNLGWYCDVTPTDIANAVAQLSTDAERRAIMSQQGQELIDGKGVTRVIRSLVQQEGS